MVGIAGGYKVPGSGGVLSPRGREIQNRIIKQIFTEYKNVCEIYLPESRNDAFKEKCGPLVRELFSEKPYRGTIEKWNISMDDIDVSMHLVDPVEKKVNISIEDGTLCGWFYIEGKIDAEYILNLFSRPD